MSTVLDWERGVALALWGKVVHEAGGFSPLKLLADHDVALRAYRNCFATVAALPNNAAKVELIVELNALYTRTFSLCAGLLALCEAWLDLGRLRPFWEVLVDELTQVHGDEWSARVWFEACVIELGRAGAFGPGKRPTWQFEPLPGADWLVWRRFKRLALEFGLVMEIVPGSTDAPKAA
jgi:hypothetical protein